MDKKTLRALKGSILKWELIVGGFESNKNGRNCTLCRTLARCEDCPVYLHTGIMHCGETPYSEFVVVAYDLAEYNHGLSLASNKKLRRLAQKEVDFLKSLLPKEGIA